MGDDEAKRNALTLVSQAARHLHEVRELERELSALVAVAARDAVGQGVAGRLVAKAAGVTPGRVSQIVAQGDHLDVIDWRARLREIADSRGTSLRRHGEGFTGEMTYPPYGRDRTTTAPTPQEPPRRHYTDGFPYAAPTSLDELHGPTSGEVTVPAHVDPRPVPVFFLDIESSRRALYRSVVRAGTVEDQRRFLDPDLLVEVWPTLVLPARSRRLWESRIPELASR